MATEAQIAANRRNAESSTGPRTKEGKSRSSRNAVTFGIYSAAGFVLPEDNRLYHHFCDSFQKELSPKGAFEQTLAAEIVHAAWRLRRCAVVESNMVDPEMDSQLDPMADLIHAPTQQAVDRARAQSHRNLQRATAELRRLQTERQVRVAHKKETNPSVSAAETPESPATKRTQSEPTQITRSQPCPCGSGVKYKRCCGRNAPAVLNGTLQQAA
jgi:hypothetical protein